MRQQVTKKSETVMHYTPYSTNIYVQNLRHGPKGFPMSSMSRFFASKVGRGAGCQSTGLASSVITQTTLFGTGSLPESVKNYKQGTPKVKRATGKLSITNG